jgi:hypothetical protein
MFSFMPMIPPFMASRLRRFNFYGKGVSAAEVFDASGASLFLLVDFFGEVLPIFLDAPVW